MKPAIRYLLEPYGTAGVYVDSNLLLLRYVGLLDRKLIQDFKRTEKYDEQAFDLLGWTLDQYREVFTTPNILTEVSNLANALWESTKKTFYPLMAREVAVTVEEYVPSVEAVRREEYVKFGLADSAIAAAAAGAYPVLTDDFPLANYLASRRAPVINFNHLRDMYMAP